MYLLSFFVSPLVLRAPSTDRPETLPHSRNLAEFYNPTPKTRGALTQKNLGPKTCKISVYFGPLPTLIANISGTAEDIQNRKTVQTMAIPPAFNEKKSGELGHQRLGITCEFGPTKMHIFAYYISALRGRCARKFSHALAIDQALLVHTPTWTGVPPKNFNREN